MADSKKYETNLFTGIVVVEDVSGKYIPKQDSRPNVWRTGKHTRGQFKKIGQVFLTENNLMIAVLSKEKLAFNKRHNFTALQRWTDRQVDLALLSEWLPQ